MTYRKIALAALAATFLSHAALAEPSADTSATLTLDRFLQTIRVKLERFTPNRALDATTAVSGVRGREVHADDIYWKGASSPTEISQIQLQRFNQALSQLEAGSIVQATEGMRDFLRDYPASPLATDASAALALMQKHPTPKIASRVFTQEWR